jgi:hypothetical protein
MVLSEAVHAGILAAERHADGEITDNELLAAREAVFQDAQKAFESALDFEPASHARMCAYQSCQYIMLPDDPHAVRHAADRVIVATQIRDSVVPNNVRNWVPDALREIVGNPFRPVAFSPSWRTSTTIALARQVYETREFTAMPILADALQDAGCETAAVLQHCRGDYSHVRGCWVIDQVFGKA